MNKYLAVFLLAIILAACTNDAEQKLIEEDPSSTEEVTVERQKKHKLFFKPFLPPWKQHLFFMKLEQIIMLMH